MALADFQPERVTITFKGGSFSVRGLSLDDMTVLMKQHLTDLDELLAMYSRNVDQQLAVAVTAQYAVSLVREAPAFTAHVIALACDEPEQIEKARRLPMPIQIEALKTIGRLTFEEVGGAKKFFESLLDLAAKVRPTATTGSPT